MYKPKNVPEVLAAKTAEFWSKLKRGNSESVDHYYNRFHELLDEINDSRETISQQDAICHFLCTLGSDFESIQNSYWLNNLPVDWQTKDWPTLLILLGFFTIHYIPMDLLPRKMFILMLIILPVSRIESIIRKRLECGFSIQENSRML
jgi:hypothetical protein